MITRCSVSRIKGQIISGWITFKTLGWLTHAIRSMSLKELQCALAIEPGDTELDDELVMDGQSITSLCASLVTVDQGTNMLISVHQSIETYLEENREKHFSIFHASMSMSLSLGTYLTLNNISGYSNQAPCATVFVGLLCTSKLGRAYSITDTSSILNINTSASSECDESQSKFEDVNMWEDKMKSSRIPKITALHLAASMGLAKIASTPLKKSPISMPSTKPARQL